MYNRYKEANQKVHSDTKKRYYKPSLYPDIEEKDSDIIHTVRPGERLDLLAYKYYGDVGLWWVISRANRLDPSDIGLDASTELRIPKEVGEVLRAYKSLNLG
tara:strand:+ start:25 stop:330 length:306 start_codon:yes stop_codon:yes gene_type:complete